MQATSMFSDTFKYGPPCCIFPLQFLGTELFIALDQVSQNLVLELEGFDGSSASLAEAVTQTIELIVPFTGAFLQPFHLSNQYQSFEIRTGTVVANSPGHP